ncbi:MAG: FlgO family outer membrane protein [Candidatus Omnitrophota bacterium]
MNMKRRIVLLIVTVWFLTGCASVPLLHRDTSRDIDIKKLSRMLNDTLEKPSLKNQEIGLLTFVNLNHLDQAEKLGRLLQQRLSHALFGWGFRIVEIRMGEKIYFDPKAGEMNLTRLKEHLKDKDEFKEIKCLIIGTYIDAGDYVYVDSKLVELENSLVRASGEIKIKKGKYLDQLLDGGEGSAEVYERFPDKKEK